MVDVEAKLCPKCGAYWRCDCSLEDLASPAYVADGACKHDWTDAVGVDLDDERLSLNQAKVLVCRLCGLYAVEERV